MYEQEYLIKRFYSQYDDKTEDLSAYGLMKPKLENKNKKTYIVNFLKICELLGRSTEQIKLYIEKELSADISLSADGVMIITGIYKQLAIDTVFKRYKKMFVECKICSSTNTAITKENRIQFISCQKCKARTPTNIKD